MKCLLLFLTFLVLSLAANDFIDKDDNDSTVSSRALCPGGGNCNNRGVCTNNGTCNCYGGYVGYDCASELIPINPRVTYTYTLSPGQWVFYTIPTRFGSGMIIVVNTTGGNGDVDLYGRPNSIPSRSSYTIADTSSSLNFVVNNPNPGTATWYIGMYGYTRASFRINVDTGSRCPGDCSGSTHGVCLLNGTCSCLSGYTGSDCSIGTTTLTTSPITGTAPSGGWVYYAYSAQSRSPFAINVVASSGDPDLYIKQGAFPSLYSFDYRDQTRNNNVTIQINSPATAYYYIGIYGYNVQSGFTIKAVSSSNNQPVCPNSCSLRGTCAQGACQCTSAFIGTYCQTMVGAVSIGTPVSGYVTTGLWNYYHYDSYASSNMFISVTQTMGGWSSDCDIYVKAGAIPTSTYYDYADTSIRQNFNLSIADPGSATWNIGIKGASLGNCTYTITTTLTSNCPSNCSGHGQCIGEGICRCDSGYAGDDCSQNGNELNNGETVTDVITNATGWKYYQFDARGSFFAVNLLETNSTGFLWLYVSKDSAPDNRDYDYADLSVNQFHSVTAKTTPSIWFVGVYANPYALGDVSYKLAAWSTPSQM